MYDTVRLSYEKEEYSSSSSSHKRSCYWTYQQQHKLPSIHALKTRRMGNPTQLMQVSLTNSQPVNSEKKPEHHHDLTGLFVILLLC
jgi:hypothetical protein